MILKILIQREKKTTKNRRAIAVFGSCGGSAAVSSQFYIVLYESNYYARFQCSNSYFGRVPCYVPKNAMSAPLPPSLIFGLGYFLSYRVYITYPYLLRLDYNLCLNIF